MPTEPAAPEPIVLNHPWPFPLMGVGGQLRPVVYEKPPLKPLRQVPPPSEWTQEEIL